MPPNIVLSSVPRSKKSGMYITDTMYVVHKLLSGVIHRAVVSSVSVNP